VILLISPINLFGLMAGSSSGMFEEDSPDLRIDSNAETSPFNSVGSLTIQSFGRTHRGTAVALSPFHVLTAGHNVDTDDDGVIDFGIELTFQVNAGAAQIYQPSLIHLHPDFSGFGNPDIHDDLAILKFDQPLPESLNFASLWTDPLEVGLQGSLVGYGRSGYGNIGYASLANPLDKRVGGNVVDGFFLDDEGSSRAEVFWYDFDNPSTFGQAGGSLGNTIETLIGSGDSGGPFFIEVEGAFSLAGINTFTQGAGLGRFGENGGGIWLAPYNDWIASVTAIPEPAVTMGILSLLSSAAVIKRHYKRKRLLNSQVHHPENVNHETMPSV
jgi:hypothetical protein